MGKGFPCYRGKDTWLAYEKGQGTRANGSPSLQKSLFSSLTNTTDTRYHLLLYMGRGENESRYMGFDGNGFSCLPW